MIDLKRKSTWKVSMGFATGDARRLSDRWFYIVGTSKNLSAPEAMNVIRRNAYSHNDDICADWVFELSDELTGEPLSIVDIAHVEEMSLEIMLGEISLIESD